MSPKGLFLTFLVFFSLLSSALVLVPGDTTTSAQTSSPEDWPMFRLDYLHTGYKEGVAPDTNDLGWLFDTGTNNQWVVSSPVIVDGYVYIGSDNGRLYKLDARTGGEIWNYTAGSGTRGQFWSSPYVDVENGMVFCHASGVHAVDIETGERIWRFETEIREFSSPVVFEEMVFVGSYDNHLYCLPQFDPNEDGNITDDEVIWYYETGEYKSGVHTEGTGGAISTTVAIADGKVFAAEQTRFNSGTTYSDYYVFCVPVEDEDGSGVIEHDEIIWKYKIGEKVPVIETDIPGEGAEAFSSPTINLEENKLYIGSRASQDTGLQYLYALTLDHDSNGMDDDLDGITDNEGELVWRTATDNEIYSTPSLHDGNIFFGTGQYSVSAAGSVYCVRESDGGVVWQSENDRGFLSSALVADGKVFIGSNDDNLYAFDEEGGDELWSYLAESSSSYNAFGSSPSLYEGTVTIGCCNGIVYSFFAAGDNDPPTVKIDEPYTGETIDGIFDIRGKASDDSGVAKVEISINNGSWSRTKLVDGEKWNYTWDTGGIANGTYNISARAFDGMLYSNIVTVMVNVREGNATGSPPDDDDDEFEIAGMNGYAVVGGGAAAAVVVGTVALVLLKRRREEEDEDEEDEYPDAEIM